MPGDDLVTGLVTLRQYDHKAYDVHVDGQPTGAFVLGAWVGWELRVRGQAAVHRQFAALGGARDWLRSGEGRTWLDGLATP